MTNECPGYVFSVLRTDDWSAVFRQTGISIQKGGLKRYCLYARKVEERQP